jgi:hypothetical protein
MSARYAAVTQFHTKGAGQVSLLDAFVGKIAEGRGYCGVTNSPCVDSASGQYRSSVNPLARSSIASIWSTGADDLIDPNIVANETCAASRPVPSLTSPIGGTTPVGSNRSHRSLSKTST